MKIVWDEPKRSADILKHGMDFMEVDDTFLINAVVLPAHSGRFRALGRLGGGRTVSIVFRPLGTEAISIVSLRSASASERRMLDD